MSQKEVSIVGRNNTKAAVTGQNELLVKVNSFDSNAFNSSSNTRTPVIVRSSASGSTTSNAYSVSIANVGSANGTVDSVTLKPGESINFDPGLNNVLVSVPFNATGTEFLIISII